MKSIPSFLLLFCLALLNPAHAREKKVPVTIIAGGETHGMLRPCDCPDAPGGGLAQRAAVIDSIRRRGPVLLIDAGGFAAGGIYDSYTEGREADSLRTAATVRAMGAMGYDAVAIGDEELQYPVRWLVELARQSNLPLVSANVRFTRGNYVAPRFLVVNRGGYRFGITAVTTQERLFPLDTTVRVREPVESLKEIWAEMTAASDVQCIVSHLGEEHSRKLAGLFPRARIIVNGHRKTSTEPAIRVGQTTLLQFGYEGKSLSTVSGMFGPQTRGPFPGHWITIGEGLAEDSTVAAILRETAPVTPVRTAFYDLYIMSRCTYGIAALREMVSFARRVPEALLNVWFVGSVAPDSSLSSLHGAEEIEDEMLWLSVQHLYPDRWMDFLTARAFLDLPTADLLVQLEIDTAQVNSWVHREGMAALTDHYLRSMRLRITASPTLFVNNTPYRESISWKRLGKTHCGRHKAGLWCDSLPVCFDDPDCRSPGKRGECVVEGEESRCVFHDDTTFTFTVLRSARTRQKPEQIIIGKTLELFPAAIIDTVDWESERGKHLAEQYAAGALPLYLFDPAVRKAFHFSRIERGLVQRADRLGFREGIVRRNFFPHRPPTEGTVEVFVDPLATTLRRAVEDVVANAQPGAIRVYPILREDPSLPASGPEEQLRREEAERWLVLGAGYPRQFTRYRHASLTQPASSYWFLHLRGAGVRMGRFMRTREGMAGLLTNHWQRMQELEIRGPCAIVFENREVAAAESAQEITELLENRF